MSVLSVIPGTDKLVDATFAYGPTTAFSFLVALMITIIAVLMYAVASLYKHNVKLNMLISQAIEKDKTNVIEITMTNRESAAMLRKDLENQTRMLHECAERDKECLLNQRIIIDGIRRIKGVEL